MSQFHFLLMSLSAFFSFTFIFLNSLLSRFFLAKFFTSLFNVIFSTFLCSKLTFLILPFFFLFSSSCLLNYRPLRFLLHFLIFSSLSFPIKPRYLLHFFFFFTISLSYISFYTFLNHFPYYLLLLFVSPFSSFFFNFHFIFIFIFSLSILFHYCKILLLL